MSTLVCVNVTGTTLVQYWSENGEEYETSNVFSSVDELEEHLQYLLSVSEYMQETKAAGLYEEALVSL